MLAEPTATETATALLPQVHIDPVDYLLVDLATGRHLPGDAIHVEQLGHEHGLTADDAAEAVDEAWRLGLLTCGPTTTSGIVRWTPEHSQVQLHRLARAMVGAVSGARTRASLCSVIDGEQVRRGAVELFGLTTPHDLDVFLEVARALLGSWAPLLLDELVVPVAVLFSDTSRRVHGFEPAAGAGTRDEIVRDIVSSLIDGRADDFSTLVADYVMAMSIH